MKADLVLASLLISSTDTDVDNAGYAMATLLGARQTTLLGHVKCKKYSTFWSGCLNLVQRYAWQTHIRRGFRSLGRNVHFYDARSPKDALEGLIQNGSVTEANFLEMLGILLFTGAPIRVQERGSGHIVMKTNTRLEAGHYDVYCNSKCCVLGVCELVCTNE